MYKPTVAVIVINRDRPELTDAVVEQVRSMGVGLEKQLFVVEAGSRPAGQSKYKTHYFRDRNYKGRYYAFNQGLKFAHQVRPQWDYYWFVCNDIVFPDGQDTLRLLWDAMQMDPRMACIGPGEPDADDYEGCHPKPGRIWHKASTIHGLAMLMRGQAYREVGYCSPKFRYSQGAGTVLSYDLYRNNWFMAYSDVTTVYHAPGGSTYGKVVKITRHEYQRRARRFASNYFRKNYGENWDELFTSVLPDDVEVNMYPLQKDIWNRKLAFYPKDSYPEFFRIGSIIKQRLRRLLGLSSCH